MRRVAIAILLLCLGPLWIYAANPKERRFIQAGMGEGEVLAKIGAPDKETLDTGCAAQVTVKRWIYLPAPGDEETVTTVVLGGGRVIQVTREVARASAGASERRFIEKGMSEGEVLARVGEPDRESQDTGARAAEAVLRWIYLPAPGDEQTTTTVVLNEGVVIQVERAVTR